jgi:hypothetical protein
MKFQDFISPMLVAMPLALAGQSYDVSIIPQDIIRTGTFLLEEKYLETTVSKKIVLP